MINFIGFVLAFSLILFMILAIMHGMASEQQRGQNLTIFAFSFAISLFICLMLFDSQQKQEEDKRILAEEYKSEIENLKDELGAAKVGKQDAERRIYNYCDDVISSKKRLSEEDNDLCKSVW